MIAQFGHERIILINGVYGLIVLVRLNGHHYLHWLYDWPTEAN